MNTLRMIRFAALGLLFGSTLLGAETSLEVISKPQNARPSSFGDSGELELSDDGKWAVFTSSGNGLVTNDHNGFFLDVFLRNNETGEITLVSKAAGMSGGGSGNSFGAQLSEDGRFVVFESEASDLVTGDTNDAADVFLLDRGTNMLGTNLVLLSRAPDGSSALGVSGAAFMSLDSKYVFLETLAALSALDTNNSVDLYRIEIGAEPSAGIELVSARSNSLEAASVPFASEVIGNFVASADATGRYVAFVSSGTNHVPGFPAGTGTQTPPPQIFLRDMVGGTNAWLTRSTNGSGASIVGNAEVGRDGRRVVFLASNILPTATTPPANSTFLYVYEIGADERPRLVTTTLAPVESFDLSADGRTVVFASSNQVYLADLGGATVSLVSQTPGRFPASGISTDPVISDDGTYVVFTSTATNLAGAPTDELLQTYRFNRETKEVVLMSRAAAPEVGGADEDTLFPVISGDGSTIGFQSYAGNVVTNDNELSNDVFIVPNNATGAVMLASSPHPLSVPGTASGQSFVENQAISLDGRFVIFSSDADDVVEGDEDEARDLFLRDRVSGTTELISFLPDGSEQTEAVTFVGASRDASRIAYFVTEVVTNTTVRCAYVYERATGSNTLVSVSPAGEATNTAGPMLLSPDGRYFVFRSEVISGPILIRDLTAKVTTQYTPPTTSTGFPIGREPISISPHGKYLLTRNTPQSVAIHLLNERKFLTNVSTFLISDWFTLDESVLFTELPFPSGAQPTLGLYPLNGGTTNVVATNANAVAMSLDGSAIAYRQRVYPTNHFYIVYNTADGTHSPIVHDGTNWTGRIRSATFSADGRYLAIVTTSTLVGSADHSFNKIYVYDTVLKTFRAAGVNAAGEPAEFGLGNPSLSASGSVLVFDTFSANLATNDLNISSDVFVSRFTPVDSDTDGLEDGWEMIYFGGLTINSETDSDSDGVSNREEFAAGTDPNSASSRLVLTMERGVEADTLVITAPTSFGRTYVLEFCDNLAVGDWERASEPQIALEETLTFEVAIREGDGFFRVAPVP